MAHEIGSFRLSQVNGFVRNELVSVLGRVGGQGETRIVFVQQHIFATLDGLGVWRAIQQQLPSVVGVFAFQEAVDYVVAQHVVYVLDPDLEMLRPLLAHALAYTQRFPKTTPHVFFVPQKPLIAEQILENDFKIRQTFPELTLEELDLDLVSTEEDTALMLQPNTFKHLFVDGDVTSLRWIARMILKMEATRVGAIPCIRAKGDKACRVLQILRRLQAEVGGEFLTDLTSEVDRLFVVDRSVDLVTPLLTQLTYEGLIDELYGIEGCKATFPFALGEGGNVGGSEVPLDNNDRLFAEIRDKNFTNVGATLYQKSLWVKQSYDKRKDVHQLKELKEFMKGLPEMQELHRLIGVHTTVATEIGKVTQSASFRKRIRMEQLIIQQSNEKEILEYIDELVNRQEPLCSVLRLLCLFSVVNGGLRSRDYDAFKESMMLSYGIPQIIGSFFALERCGLLRKADGKGANFSALRKQFRLWNDTLNEKQPNDVAYAYSGYSSLLVRMVETLLLAPQSWGAGDSALNLVPGAITEVRTDVETPGAVTSTMVFVIGGVTAAELSSLRFLQEKLSNAGRPQNLMIASTDITSGKRFVASVLPFVPLGVTVSSV